LTKKPLINECHWKKRIGFILSEKQDHWWKLSNNINVKELTDEIQEIINSHAIPEITKHLSDTNLALLWLHGNSEGLTNFQRLVYLTVFLRKYNNNKLSLISDELLAFTKNKQNESAARHHFKQLDIFFDEQ
jgi:hypothetical protein